MDCWFQILDDTSYEGKEEFEVMLSSPIEPARLGKLKTATVIINGPNDGKYQYRIIGQDQLNNNIVMIT